MFQFELDKSAERHSQSQIDNQMGLFLMEVPGVGATQILNLFISNSMRYNNLTWCLNAAWKKPPVLDHVCEREPSQIRNTVKQVVTMFGDGKCGGIRMKWDFSLPDEVLVLSRKRFLLVTVLRHPVYRTVNAYYGSVARKVTTLRKFAENEKVYYQKYGCRNHQVKQLAGVLEACSQYDEIDKEYIRKNLLYIVKRNMKTFDVIGIFERMTDTLNYFQFKFKWANKSSPEIRDLLKSARSSVPAKVSAQDYEFIAKTNSLEMEVYDYALQLFEKQLEQMQLAAK